MPSLFTFETDQLVPEEEARTLTQPFWADLTQIWLRAFAEYGKIGEEQRARLAGTVFVPPVNIFAFAQSFARELFVNRESEGILRCDDDLGVVGFYVHDKILIRFNTLGKDFVVHTSKTDTERRKKYFRQDPIAGLNNAATRLTVGYVPDPTKTVLTSVMMSCQLVLCHS